MCLSLLWDNSLVYARSVRRPQAVSSSLCRNCVWRRLISQLGDANAAACATHVVENAVDCLSIFRSILAILVKAWSVSRRMGCPPRTEWNVCFLRVCTRTARRAAGLSDVGTSGNKPLWWCRRDRDAVGTGGRAVERKKGLLSSY